MLRGRSAEFANRRATAGECRKLLMLQRKAEVLCIERDGTSHILDLITDAMDTLDERTCVHVRRRCMRHAVRSGIARDAYEFHLLFGIQRGEQVRLARDGYRVKTLISYGEQWFPWYMRRLAERPANLVFVAKSMVSR